MENINEFERQLNELLDMAEPLGMTDSTLHHIFLTLALRYHMRVLGGKYIHGEESKVEIRH